ncbi:SRPBCC family protein [Pontixanthobacter aquaemixtae]|uniref:SRPBCC family protein n=1 Tax=Pontixanthobacter aquaemixtae TaxID=1958940 RepID=A0A844ZT19_9SPHN|nr:SRPBCC family protein [Pontixanthobacter aquaemixtae]MXO90624.1 SRPBCC family protein [Pontixanthobacter aquaemixtae]
MYTKLLIAAAASCALVHPAQAKVVELEEDAFVTRDSRVVTADQRATWLALITPGDWWNSAHTFSGDSKNMMLTPQANGCFCERIPADDTQATIGLAGSVKHMTVSLAIPDQALRMEGALGPLQSEPVDGILTVTLAKAEEGTRITFEYAVGGYMRFEVPAIAKAVDNVMSQQLSGLAKSLGVVESEAEKPEPDAPEEEATDESADPVSSSEEEGDEEKAEPRISVDEAFGDLNDDQ